MALKDQLRAEFKFDEMSTIIEHLASRHHDALRYRQARDMVTLHDEYFDFATYVPPPSSVRDPMTRFSQYAVVANDASAAYSVAPVANASRIM